MTAVAQQHLHSRASAAAYRARTLWPGPLGDVVSERCMDAVHFPAIGAGTRTAALIDDVLGRRPLADELAAYARSFEALAEQAETPDERRPGLRQAAALLRMADEVEQVPGRTVRVEMGAA